MTPKQEMDYRNYDMEHGIGLHTYNLFQILEKNNMISEDFNIKIVLSILLNENFKRFNKTESHIDYNYLERFPNEILNIINENYADYESVL